MLEVMGPGLHTEDPQLRSMGKPSPVIAPGATVRIAADYEQQRALNAPNASMANRNPWVLVEVVDSPLPAQRGWKGWIHLDTTKPAPVHATPWVTTTLPNASVLCPRAESNDLQCRVSLPAETAVHVLGCAGPQVHVELWTGDGQYVHGFVLAHQFPSNPCTTAKE